MVARDGIAAANPAARPLRAFARELVGRASSPALACIAVAAFGATWAIAQYAPNAWLGGVFAYSIAAGALAALSDRHIMIVSARTASRKTSLLVPLRIIRLFANAVTIASAIAFVLFGVAAVMGSIGVGG